jgi:hypothetical protein
LNRTRLFGARWDALFSPRVRDEAMGRAQALVEAAAGSPGNISPAQSDTERQQAWFEDVEASRRGHPDAVFK